MSIPTPSAETNPCCSNKNCGMVIKSLIILCFIVPFILAALQISFSFCVAIMLICLVLSIVAIVKGSKAFGITMLIVTVLIGGPGSCGVAVIFNEDARSLICQGVNQVQLAQKLAAAQEAGNTEEEAKIQAEVDAAEKKLTEELEKIQQRD